MITVKIDTTKMSATHEVLLANAVMRMNHVLNHAYFLSNLYAECRDSKNFEGETSLLRDGCSAARIVELLKQHPISLVVEPYYSIRNVIGYGLAGDEITRLNTKYLNNYNPLNMYHQMYVGSNLLHEHSHDIGFDHDFYATKRRKNSVSYILNRAYEDAYITIYQLEKPVAKKPWWKFW